MRKLATPLRSLAVALPLLAAAHARAVEHYHNSGECLTRI